MCLAQSGQMPSSVHSSSAGSGCCHRNRERSVHYNAVHGIHHTPDHQEHMVSPQPAVEGGGRIGDNTLGPRTGALQDLKLSMLD